MFDIGPGELLLVLVFPQRVHGSDLPRAGAAHQRATRPGTPMSGTSLASITEEYLGRLDAAAWRLPGDRRVELVAEVREHIDAAMLAHPGDEAALRTVLDGLGAPEEIARAAVEQEGLPVTPSAPAQGASNVRDISTVLLLMFGGILAGIGWVVGLALLWTSTRWRTSDKWLATLVWPFGYAGVFVLSSIALFAPATQRVCRSTAVKVGDVAQETCTGGGGSLPGWLGFVIFLAVVVAPVLVAVRLLRKPRTPGAAEA
jgi:hypothetical protein